MHNKQQFQNSLFRTISHKATIILPLAIVFVMAIVATLAAQAQTYNVIYNFASGGAANSLAGLAMDSAGNLYGTTYNPNGTVFQLSNRSSTWVFTTLYNLTGGDDGVSPDSGVVIGRDGSLYGTTEYGGGSGCLQGRGCGIVFDVRPAAHAGTNINSGWSEAVIYRFTAGGWGGGPEEVQGKLVFDKEGNLYGTNRSGGSGGYGFVYKLTPSNDSWTESELYSFSGGDGAEPHSGVIFDASGDLYGTTVRGGAYGIGTVFQLSPSESRWTETTLYTFQNGNGGPYGGLVFDHSGNLYGTTYAGGSGAGGTVFELSPAGSEWMFTVLHSFSGRVGPMASLTMDASGNLYGTTMEDGAYGVGNVFKLAPSGGGWTFTSLHDFTLGSDGGITYSDVIFDAKGNLYGTTWGGGLYGDGVVWEITP